MRKLLLGHLLLSFLLCTAAAAFISVMGPFGPDELNLQDTAIMAAPYALAAIAFLIGIFSLRRGKKSAPILVAVVYGICAAWIVRGYLLYPALAIDIFLLAFFILGAALSLGYRRQQKRN